MNERLPKVESMAGSTVLPDPLKVEVECNLNLQRELAKAKATIAQMENLLREGLKYFGNSTHEWAFKTRNQFPHLDAPKR